MKTIWTIAKKEFSRFLKDKRMLLALFLPGLLIYVIYSLLGGVMDSMLGVEEDQTYNVCVVNCPDWLTEETLSPLGDFVIQTVDVPHENVEEQIKNGTFNAYLVFPNDFIIGAVSGEKQEVKLYMDSTDSVSQSAGELLASVISTLQYGEPYFLLTAQDVATEADLSSMIFSMVGPMLIIAMLMTGCVAVAPESIAGEKERGTFATMLVTPVKRGHVAIGKVAALSAISLLSGLSSFTGIVFSLPKLMGGSGVDLTALSYGAVEYLALLGVVLSTVLVMVALVSILSTFAKNVKEASSMVSPLMVIVMVVGITSSMISADAWYLYCIPLLNSVLSFNLVFTMSISPVSILLTIVVNIVVAVFFSWLLTKMFNSEKIMFSK